MLPFGFVSAPVTVYLLAKDPVIAFSIANWLSFVSEARVVRGRETFLDVTRMYLDFFELNGEAETDFRGDNSSALVSTLHRLTAGFIYPSGAEAGENDGGDGSGGDDQRH
jgi:hypothetical protein